MSKRLEEILKRQEEIRSALDANTEGLDLDALEAEARALADEKESLNSANALPRLLIQDRRRLLKLVR